VVLTGGGTAINGVDYTASAVNALIPAGAASVDITFTPIDDATPEGSETIVRTIVNSLNYVINPAQSSATVTIAANDGG
jgi:hypothetical protein